MAKLLIVDDEQNILNVIKEYAEFMGYETVCLNDGFEAVEKVKNEDFDLIVMDVMMPRLDGFSAVKKIKEFKDIPVIMLSARGEEYDKLHGFDIGVDDYVVKPFSPKELMARIKAVLARTKPSGNASINEFGILKLNKSGREVFVNGERIQLTPKEYDLLFYLVDNKGIALSREKLLEKIWGFDYFGDDRTVDTHIKTLRAGLKEAGNYILTVRGIGYKFSEDER